MLGYRKKSFARAHELLGTLRSNLEDMDTLKELQQLIAREIVRTEKKGREVRGNLKAVQHNGGAASQKRAGSLKSRLESIRQVAYIWRCFGDAIAFSYMDKFALKQCFYSAHSTNPKQGAGFLSDKLGLPAEIKFVEMALQQNVPAILTDITNTIRYGDVCLMGAPDPHLVEVKSSRNLDRRGKRQQRELEGLRPTKRTTGEEWVQFDALHLKGRKEITLINCNLVLPQDEEWPQRVATRARSLLHRLSGWCASSTRSDEVAIVHVALVLLSQQHEERTLLVTLPSFHSIHQKLRSPLGIYTRRDFHFNNC
jgi:hypothetical protein